MPDSPRLFFLALWAPETITFKKYMTCGGLLKECNYRSTLSQAGWKLHKNKRKTYTTTFQNVYITSIARQVEFLFVLKRQWMTNMLIFTNVEGRHAQTGIRSKAWWKVFSYSASFQWSEHTLRKIVLYGVQIIKLIIENILW